MGPCGGQFERSLGAFDPLDDFSLFFARKAPNVLDSQASLCFRARKPPSAVCQVNKSRKTGSSSGGSLGLQLRGSYGRVGVIRIGAFKNVKGAWNS